MPLIVQIQGRSLSISHFDGRCSEIPQAIAAVLQGQGVQRKGPVLAGRIGRKGPVQICYFVVRTKSFDFFPEITMNYISLI